MTNYLNVESSSYPCSSSTVEPSAELDCGESQAFNSLTCEVNEAVNHNRHYAGRRRLKDLLCNSLKAILLVEDVYFIL